MGCVDGGAKRKRRGRNRHYLYMYQTKVSKQAGGWLISRIAALRLASSAPRSGGGGEERMRVFVDLRCPPHVALTIPSFCALLPPHTGRSWEDSDEEADSRDAGHTATGEGGQEN